MWRRCVIWVEVACLVMLLFSGSIGVKTQAATTTQIQTQIDELKREESLIAEELRTLESQVSAHNDQIEEMIAQKNIIDQQMALLQEQLDNNTEQIQAYSVQIAQKQTQLDETEAKREELHAKHKQRIRAMEEQGSSSYWSVLFRADSFADFLDRLFMIQEISASDNRRLDELRNIEIELATVRDELLTSQKELETTRTQLLETEQELLDKQKQAEGILRELLAKGQEYQQLLAESEAKQAELMEQLAQKETEYDEAAKQEAGTQPPQSGSWVVPVPYYTLTSPFGMRFHPLLNIERMHNGVDMACAQDTPIYASRAGIVTTTDYQEYGAGNYVQIDHGDGYRSIYMHMIRYIVVPGQRVAAGEVIGYVGSTGLSDGNHLHFGISYNGVYVNPMEYLP